MAEKKSRSGTSEPKKSYSSPKMAPVSEGEKSPPKPKVAAAKPAPKPKPRRPLVTFTRWFNARGFKPHWKSGMAVHAGDTKIRRTPEEWDKLFANY